MEEVSWQNVLTFNLVAIIIICASVLAYAGVAEWRDVFTIYLIVLAGLGFMASGVYYGQAKAYKDALNVVVRYEREQKRVEQFKEEAGQPQERADAQA